MHLKFSGWYCIYRSDCQIVWKTLEWKPLLRFQLTEGCIYFAPIEPDLCLLPLISKNTLSLPLLQIKQWLIYDVNGKYGLFYD